MIEFTLTDGSPLAVRDANCVTCVGVGMTKCTVGGIEHEPGKYRVLGIGNGPTEAYVTDEYGDILRKLGWKDQPAATVDVLARRFLMQSQE